MGVNERQIIIYSSNYTVRDDLEKDAGSALQEAGSTPCTQGQWFAREQGALLAHRGNGLPGSREHSLHTGAMICQGAGCTSCTHWLRGNGLPGSRERSLHTGAMICQGVLLAHRSNDLQGSRERSLHTGAMVFQGAGSQ